jgi:hypothetical protein
MVRVHKRTVLSFPRRDPAERGNDMNRLAKSLLGGVAFGALVGTPAFALQQASGPHIKALHGGRVVNKTKMPNRGATHLTYTFGIYSYISFAQAYRQKVHVQGTFYVFSTGSVCDTDRKHFKIKQKKTEYGRASVGTETYSFGCPSGPTTIYGMDYKITDSNAQGKTDHAVGTLKTRFTRSGTKYIGNLNLDVSLAIE